MVFDALFFPFKIGIHHKHPCYMGISGPLKISRLAGSKYLGDAVMVRVSANFFGVVFK